MQRPHPTSHAHFCHSHIPELTCGVNSSIDIVSALTGGGTPQRRMDRLLISLSESTGGQTIEFVMHDQCTARSMVTFLAKGHSQCPLVSIHFLYH